MKPIPDIAYDVSEWKELDQSNLYDNLAKIYARYMVQPDKLIVSREQYNTIRTWVDPTGYPRYNVDRLNTPLGSLIVRVMR